MKIMSVNAGSSSLKFQLLEMPEEKLICSGLVERIGEGLMSHYFFKVDGKVALDRELPVKDHAVGVQLVLDGLKELRKMLVISSLTTNKIGITEIDRRIQHLEELKNI